jgi:hypothetical protein
VIVGDAEELDRASVHSAGGVHCGEVRLGADPRAPVELCVDDTTDAERRRSRRGSGTGSLRRTEGRDGEERTGDDHAASSATLR